MTYPVRFVDERGFIIRRDPDAAEPPFQTERNEQEGRFEYVGVDDGVAVYKRVPWNKLETK